MKPFLRFLLLVALLPLAAHAELHTWTDTHGRTIVARPITKTDQAITVERADGKRFDIALEQLSDADKTWALKWKPIKFTIGEHGAVKDDVTPWFMVSGPEGYRFYFEPKDLPDAIKALKEFKRLAPKAEAEGAQNGFKKTLLARQGAGETEVRPAIELRVYTGKAKLGGEWIRGREYMPDQVDYLLDFLTGFSPAKFDADRKRVENAVR